jgi:hypothetical protein
VERRAKARGRGVMVVVGRADRQRLSFAAASALVGSTRPWRHGHFFILAFLINF